MYKSTSASGEDKEIEIRDNTILIDDQPLGEQITNKGKGKYQVIHNQKVYAVEVLENSGRVLFLKVNQNKYTINLKDSLDQVLDKMGISANSEAAESDLKAPMPGMILDISVEEGSEVKKGDPIMILEAMKMENILKSPGDTTIKKILVGKGDSVNKKQVLVEFD